MRDDEWWWLLDVTERYTTSESKTAADAPSDTEQTPST